MNEQTLKAFKLCALSLANYGLFYAAGVFLARTLGAHGFEDYNVALAALALLSSLTLLGLEKYALRALPAFYERKESEHAQGFWKFSRRIVLVVSLIAAVVYALTHGFVAVVQGSSAIQPAVLAVLFLPAVALLLLLVEIAAANGKVIEATVIYRVSIPLFLLILLVGIRFFTDELSARVAILCYGLSWLFNFLLLFWLTRSSFPDRVLGAQPKFSRGEWAKRSTPFLIRGLLLTQFATAGILVLEMYRASELQAGIYAACMHTAGFILILATSTNRFYAPRVSILLERQDHSGMMELIRERARWLYPVTALYLVVMIFGGRQILGLYGPDFVAGYPALTIIAVGAAASVLFSMAPYFLHFVEEDRTVVVVTAVAAGVHIGLLFLLAGRFGMTGAAVAYAISAGGMSVALGVIGFRRLKQIRTSASTVQAY